LEKGRISFSYRQGPAAQLFAKTQEVKTMKARFAPFLLAAFLLATGLGQTSKPSVLRWKYGAPNAVTEVRNATQVKGLKTDDLHVYVALFDIKDTDYNRAWVQVVNRGKTPIEIDPQSAFLKDGRMVRPEEPEKAANGIQKVGEARSQELDANKCGMMNGGAGGGISLDCLANDSQVQLSKEVLAHSAFVAEWVRGKALKQTTVAPGEEIIGAILFKKGKKPSDYTLAIPVGGKTFEFPVSAQNEPPYFY
jgi:hypothetical protein